METNINKQDGQSIDEILYQYARDFTDWGFYKTRSSCFKSISTIEARQAIEAYCAERERLARIDEMQRILDIEAEIWRLAGSGPGLDGEPLNAEEYATRRIARIAELQKQSGSQEEND